MKPSPERGGNHRFVLADDVADQNHLRQSTALGFGAVTDGAQVALIEVFQARKYRAIGFCGARVQVPLDLDDAGNGIASLAEEFQAHRTRVLGHAVQDPARGSDQAVAALLLHAGQSPEEFVGDILAQTHLAKARALDVEPLAAQDLRVFGRLRAVLPYKIEAGHRRVMDLAKVVIEARHFQPVAVGIDHAPPQEVVDRRAPKHRLLAAGVHGDITADAGGIRGGRIDGEYEAGAFGGIADPFGNHAGAGEHRGGFHTGALARGTAIACGTAMVRGTAIAR